MSHPKTEETTIKRLLNELPRTGGQKANPQQSAMSPSTPQSPAKCYVPKHASPSTLRPNTRRFVPKHDAKHARAKHAGGNSIGCLGWLTESLGPIWLSPSVASETSLHRRVNGYHADHSPRAARQIVESQIAAILRIRIAQAIGGNFNKGNLVKCPPPPAHVFAPQRRA